MPFRRFVFCLLFLPFAVSANDVPEQRNIIGPAASGGASFNGDTHYWDVSFNYIRHVQGDWWLSIDLAYEEEITEQQAGDNTVDVRNSNITPSIGLSYSITDAWQLGGAVGKTLYSDRNDEGDNPDRDYNRLDFDDGWPLEATAEYQLFTVGAWMVTTTGSLEYDIQDREVLPSLQLFAGYTF